VNVMLGSRRDFFGLLDIFVQRVDVCRTQFLQSLVAEHRLDVGAEQLLIAFERALADHLAQLTWSAGIQPFFDPLTDSHLARLDVLAGIGGVQ